MYPILRTAYHSYKAKSKPPLTHPFEESTISMRAWPLDIDIFMEMNNGRYLTLMDIGRTEIGVRLDLFKTLKANDWGLMVGAVSARYRHRIRPFEKFTLHTRILYFDERWFYFHQQFTSQNGKKIHASFLARTAVISKKGLVPTSEVAAAMGITDDMVKEYNHPTDWLLKWEESDELHKEIMEVG